MPEAKYTSNHLEFLRTKELSDSFSGTLNTIEKFGWEAMLITGSDSNRFAYTVGIHDMFGFPELVVVGLPQEVAHRAMHHALEAMQKGVDLTVGRHREIVGEVEVKFGPVEDKWKEHVMCRADWFYCGDSFPALQLLYPDLENKFQDEQGFNEYFHQPILALGAPEGGRELEFWEANDISVIKANWKFPDGRHTTAYVSQTVFDKKEPIVYVSHDTDGSWQFLGDSMSDGGGPVIVCLHHPLDNDASIEELHNLPSGWIAERSVPGAPWERYERGPEEESA